MQQYFSKKRENDILYLDSCDFHHIKNVMRIKSHDSVIVGYDGILYMCLMNEDLKSATIKSVYKESDETKVIVYMPVLSDEKMSFIIEFIKDIFFVSIKRLNIKRENVFNAIIKL